jgi:hypothetical protein
MTHQRVAIAHDSHIKLRTTGEVGRPDLGMSVGGFPKLPRPTRRAVGGRCGRPGRG